MKYRASNGITAPVELTEAEARADFERAQHVDGEFGQRFVICPVGEMGHVLTCAATLYERLADAPQRLRRRRPPH